MELNEYFKQFDRLAVAVSGGADSACLLREVTAALGASRVLAISVKSVCMPARSLQTARRVAELCGVEHVVLMVETLEQDELNAILRCAACRKRMLQAVMEEAWVRGCEHVVDGVHLDDVASGAPEYEMPSLLGIISPFCACGMAAAQVAALRGRQAPILNRACLMTRIAPDVPVTYGLLERLDELEQGLDALGLYGARVWFDGQFVCIGHDDGAALTDKWVQASDCARQNGFAARRAQV